MTEKTVLVTGGAGFIGYHLTKKLLNDGYRIVSVDKMTIMILILKRTESGILGIMGALTSLSLWILRTKRH